MDRKKLPSLDEWLKDAKSDPVSAECGMFLFHNGVVRKTARAQAREGKDSPQVIGMHFSYDGEKAEAARKAVLGMDGIKYARIWLGEGELNVGDDIMLVLVGGDTRPHVIDALQSLVGELKNNCVTETEILQ